MRFIVYCVFTVALTLGNTALGDLLLVAAKNGDAPIIGRNEFAFSGGSATIDLFLVESTGLDFWAGSTQITVVRQSGTPSGNESNLQLGPALNPISGPATTFNLGPPPRLTFNGTAFLPKIRATSGTGISYLKLGQFDVTPVVGSPLVYSWDDFNAADNLVVTATGDSSDGINLIRGGDASVISASSNFSVVPEPSSFALVGGLGVLLAFRQRRTA